MADRLMTTVAQFGNAPYPKAMENVVKLIIRTPQECAKSIDKCKSCAASELVAELRATHDDVLLCKDCWFKLWPRIAERIWSKP